MKKQNSNETNVKKQKTNKFLLLWYTHPRIAIVFSLIFVNLTVILLFTSVLSIIRQTNFFEELAYIFAFTMSSDGVYDFFNSGEDVLCFIIKIVLALVQMLIFSGALIGFSTDLLQTMIDKRINNLGKIDISDHYVFLNWSSISPHLIYDLSFLEGNKNIVILCEQDREEVLNSIQNIFIERNRKLENVRLFVKKGDPSSPKHLDDVSLSKAKYVGVFLAGVEDDGSHSIPTNDISALKSLFTIMNVAKNANIVVEVEEHETVEKVEKLIETIDSELSQRIIVFSHNAVLGHILGRTLINSTLTEVYHHLLSYDGAEFYCIGTCDIKDALCTYNDCIPIINYDDDGNGTRDRLYILSDNEESLGVRKEKTDFTKPLAYNENIEKQAFTVFMLSSSGDDRFIIEELKNCSRLYGFNINARSFAYSDNFNEIVEEIKNTPGKKRILLLSSDNHNVTNQDEDIFLTALQFKLCGCLGDDVELLAEIVNPANLNSLKNFGLMSVIVSNRIISLFMVQLLTHPASKKFYRDLITTDDNNVKNDGDVDLEVFKAKEFLEFEEETLTFACKSELVHSFYAASNQTKMIIGVKPAGQNEILYLCDKMDEMVDIVINKDDELVLISY